MELFGPMIRALEAWSKQNLASKKLEQVWGFAGIPGGGGIASVATIEELNALMAELPLSQFSDVQIYPLIDLDRAIADGLRAFERMMPPRS